MWVELCNSNYEQIITKQCMKRLVVMKYLVFLIFGIEEKLEAQGSHSKGR